MSVKETVNDFIQGVKSGKYEVVASNFETGEDTVSKQSSFIFKALVNRDFELHERLKEELNDLAEKRDRLDAFMSKNNIFTDLSYEEQYAMQRQREDMTDYMAALNKRIRLIEERMK